MYSALCKLNMKPIEGTTHPTQHLNKKQKSVNLIIWLLIYLIILKVKHLI